MKKQTTIAIILAATITMVLFGLNSKAGENPDEDTLPFFVKTKKPIVNAEDHTIPVPDVLKDGQVTVCTSAGKCSKFDSNTFAVVPRKYKSHKHNEAIPVINNITNDYLTVNVITKGEPVLIDKTKKNQLVLLGGESMTLPYAKSISGSLTEYGNHPEFDLGIQYSHMFSNIVGLGQITKNGSAYLGIGFGF